MLLWLVASRFVVLLLGTSSVGKHLLLATALLALLPVAHSATTLMCASEATICVGWPQHSKVSCAGNGRWTTASGSQWQYSRYIGAPDLPGGTLEIDISSTVRGSWSGLKKLVCASDHNCALFDDGEVWCWGDCRRFTSDGTCSHGIPHQVTFTVDEDVIDLASGDYIKCAIFSNKKVQCWGAGTGNLAAANGYDDGCEDAGWCQCGDSCEDPTRFIELSNNDPIKAEWVDCGLRHCCAVLSADMHGGEQRVACWGENDMAELGQVDVGSSMPHPTWRCTWAQASTTTPSYGIPALHRSKTALLVENRYDDSYLVVGSAAVPALGIVSHGSSQDACVLNASSHILCWGSAYARPWAAVQWGEYPTPVTLVTRGVTHSYGNNINKCAFSCGVPGDCGAASWMGWKVAQCDNANSASTDCGMPTGALEPQDSGTPVTAARLFPWAGGGWENGHPSTLAIEADGKTVWGWGSNHKNKLFSGSTGFYNNPVDLTDELQGPLDAGETIAAVAKTARVTLVGTNTGRIYGIGFNEYRELGKSTRDDLATWTDLTSTWLVPSPPAPPSLPPPSMPPTPAPETSWRITMNSNHGGSRPSWGASDSVQLTEAGFLDGNLLRVPGIPLRHTGGGGACVYACSTCNKKILKAQNCTSLASTTRSIRRPRICKWALTCNTMTSVGRRCRVTSGSAGARSTTGGGQAL